MIYLCPIFNAAIGITLHCPRRTSHNTALKEEENKNKKHTMHLPLLNTL